ncbi:Catechol-2,3-dioxygenase [compost metagenome]
MIGHVHFHVGDLGEAKKFYVDTLGFELTAHYGDAAMFISAGGYHHHMGLNIWAGQGAPAAPADAAGIDYFTLLLPSIQERDAVAERVRSAGYQVEGGGGIVGVTDRWSIGIKLLVKP